MNEPLKVPPPGLDGTWRDSCVVCLQGTDTGLAFVGEAEWVIAGLTVLGIPEDQGTTMISEVTGCAPGNVPLGEVTMHVRVCAKCAAASGMGLTVGLLSDAAGVPGYRQPKGTP